MNLPFCPRCGAAASGPGAFCVICGTSLAAPEPPPAQPAAPAPAFDAAQPPVTPAPTVPEAVVPPPVAQVPEPLAPAPVEFAAPPAPAPIAPAFEPVAPVAPAPVEFAAPPAPAPVAPAPVEFAAPPEPAAPAPVAPAFEQVAPVAPAPVEFAAPPAPAPIAPAPEPVAPVAPAPEQVAPIAPAFFAAQATAAQPPAVEPSPFQPPAVEPSPFQPPAVEPSPFQPPVAQPEFQPPVAQPAAAEPAAAEQIVPSVQPSDQTQYFTPVPPAGAPAAFGQTPFDTSAQTQQWSVPPQPPMPGQLPPQYPGQPGQPGQFGGQPGQFAGQPGQFAGQFPGQPGQFQGQYPGMQPGQPGIPGQPAWGQPMMPAAPAPKRRPVKLIAALVGLALVVAVAGGGAYLLLFSGPDMASQLVTKMAARDATAGDLLASPATLVDTAGKMGLVGLPGSVSTTLENLKTEKPKSAPAGVTVSGKDEAFVATFKLKASGNGKTTEANETLTVVTHKGDDGKTKITTVKVDSPLKFDATAYFSKGTDQASADQVATDLRNGNKWLSGVDVKVTPTPSPIAPGQKVTIVPGHLTSYSQTKAGTPGVHTAWVVTVAAGGNSIVTLTASEADTQNATDDQVSKGDIDDATAIAAAQNVISQFEAAVSSGNVANAQALVTGGVSQLKSSGLAQMKKTPLDKAGGSAADTGTPTVTAGDYILALGADGNWTIDADKTPLISTVYAGTSHVENLYFKDGQTGCKTNIDIKLQRVEFYTNGRAPRAVFSFANTKDCGQNDQIYEMKVIWPGNTAGTLMTPGVPGTGGVGTTLRYIDLPTELTADSHPITIVITDYGSGDAKLPNAMTFKTV